MVKRNRVAVAVCALVLVLGGLGAWQTVEARIQTLRAEKGETELARVLRTLGGNDQTAMDDRQRVAGVRSLRHALEKERTGPMTGERRKLLDRGVQYLDGMRPYAARNAAPSSELAETYQEVATIYEPNQQARALSLY